MFGDRFTWGVGTGEALNEHVHGDRWPPADVRLEMLEEAIEVIRRLWGGESVTHRGRHYTVEDARLFDVPEPAPPILVSAFGSQSADLAARLGDGLWTTGPRTEVIDEYRAAGGDGPVWSQLSFCWDRDREAAVERAHRMWPNTGLPGQLAQDLRTVEHMEQATKLVSPEDIEGSGMPLGPDPGPILESIAESEKAGIGFIYLHQIGDLTRRVLGVLGAGVAARVDQVIRGLGVRTQSIGVKFDVDHSPPGPTPKAFPSTPNRVPQ
jgi:G6PDH family F420-dependent oxidoreductase